MQSGSKVILTGYIIWSLSPGNTAQSGFVNEYGSSIFQLNRNNLLVLILSISLLIVAENKKFLWRGREQEGRQTDWLYSITLANATGLLAGI